LPVLINAAINISSCPKTHNPEKIHPTVGQKISCSYLPGKPAPTLPGKHNLLITVKKLILQPV
jgi:hypothetical protein